MALEPVGVGVVRVGSMRAPWLKENRRDDHKRDGDRCVSSKSTRRGIRRNPWLDV